MSGVVFEDLNGDGTFGGTDPGLAGVVLTLTGTDSQNNAVGPLTVKTAADGSYQFKNLPAGTYAISKTQPVDLIDGPASVGSLQGATQGDDTVSGVVVAVGGSGTGYNFSEHGLTTTLVSINLFLNSTPSGQQVLQNYINQSYTGSSVSTDVASGVASIIAPPSVSVPAGPLSVSPTGTLAISGVSVGDASLQAASDNVQLTLAVQQGTLNVATGISGGVTSAQVLGNGTGTVTVTAPLAAVDALLAAASGLSYAPKSGAAGTSDNLTVTANDLGNTPLGTAQSTTRSVQIEVGGA